MAQAGANSWSIEYVIGRILDDVRRDVAQFGFPDDPERARRYERYKRRIGDLNLESGQYESVVRRMAEILDV